MAQRIGGGTCLERCPTAEAARASVDTHLQAQIDREAAWKAGEAEREARRKAEEEERAKQAAEAAEQERRHLEAIMGCIEPVRTFVRTFIAAHGIEMLKDCIRQLRLEAAKARAAAEVPDMTVDEETFRSAMEEAQDIFYTTLNEARHYLVGGNAHVDWCLAELDGKLDNWLNGSGRYTLESSIEWDYPDSESNFLDEFGSQEEEEEA